MEKRYLQIFYRDRLIGAFENVKNFTESEDKNIISFDSDDGSFTYERGLNDLYTCDENNIKFDSYKLVGRRTLLKHTDNLRDVYRGELERNSGEREIESSESYSLNRLIWDDCTPTRNRRPTTEADIEEDIHVEDFGDAEELFVKLLELADYEEEDLDLDEDASVNDKIEYLLGVFEDPGDGSPNILYCLVNGEEVDGAYPYEGMDDLDLKHCFEEDVIENIKQHGEFEEEEFDDEFYDDSTEVDESFDKNIKSLDSYIATLPLDEEICPICGDDVNEPCEKCKAEMEKKICPKCGKEICECDKQKLDEENVNEKLSDSFIKSLEGLVGETLIFNKTGEEGKVIAVHVDPNTILEPYSIDSISGSSTIEVDFNGKVREILLDPSSNYYFKDQGAQSLLNSMVGEAKASFERDRKAEQEKINKETIELVKKHVEDGYDTLYKYYTDKIKTAPRGDVPNCYELNRDLYIDEYKKLKDQGKIVRPWDEAIKDSIYTIADNYPGDVDELVKWLKENVVSITIDPARTEDPEKFKKKIEWLHDNYGTQISSSYDATARHASGDMKNYNINLKAGCEASAPKELYDWTVKKMKMAKGILTEFEGPAYDKVTNSIQSRRVVLDLLANPDYNNFFKLGKQEEKNNESLNEADKDPYFDENTKWFTFGPINGEKRCVSCEDWSDLGPIDEETFRKLWDEGWRWKW